MKEHPDPGSKDPEEDYPKFGLLDQVCDGRWKESTLIGGEGDGRLVLLVSYAQWNKHKVSKITWTYEPVLCQVVCWRTAAGALW